MTFAFHNSQSKGYRNPFGAVKKGTKVEIILETEVFSKVELNLTFFNKRKENIVMNYENMGGLGARYKAEVYTENELGLINYYFTIENNDNKYFYGNNDEALGGEGKIYTENPKQYQITVYEDQYIPNWYKEGVVYQIFVDRFFNGNEDGHINSPKRNSFIYSNWYDEPMYIKNMDGSIARWDFYGGNIRGVINKLPYLKDLGITIIYLNPIFKAFSCHKYDTGDYEKIDEMFGSEEDFKELCLKAKENGIRIILDGVFNHTGANSKYFNKFGEYEGLGAYESKKSPYYKWYRFRKFPNDYECWWGDKNLPDLEELEPSYLDYIITGRNSISAKWIKLGASGWRLDVADELPDKFIELLKQRIRKEDRESILIGEVWEDASNKISYGEKRKYLFGNELDSVINYPFRQAIIDYVIGDITAENCKRHMLSIYENYPRDIFYSNMNLLGNHDTERVLTKLRGDIRNLELAVLMIMTLPGVPLVYYGDEAGLTGGKDPDNRKTYPWGKENNEILSIYKKLISLRKEDEIFIKGDLSIGSISKEILSYKRSYRNNHIVIIINSSDKSKTISVIDLLRYQFKLDLKGADEKFKNPTIIKPKGYIILKDL